MILFVFEGERREPELYRTLESLYFPKPNDNIICSFGNNIYDLYEKMAELDGDGDIVAVLKQRLGERGDHVLDGVRSSEISQTFLFFDYDFHNTNMPLAELNRRLALMLDMFAEETENGRLYINYPMVESIRYVKQLPDTDYRGYVVSRADCRHFKRLAASFSFYGNLDFIAFKAGRVTSREQFDTVKGNWAILTEMNVSKANYIATGNYAVPDTGEAITQSLVFSGQLGKYVEKHDCVAVLNSFPLFLFDYFGKGAMPVGTELL